MCAVAAAEAAPLSNASGAAATASATSLILVHGPRIAPQSRGDTFVKRMRQELDSLTGQSEVFKVASFAGLRVWSV